MPVTSHPLATSRRYGVVADVTTGPGNLIGVDIGGDNAGNDWDSGEHEFCPALASYAVPTVGDVVALLGVPGSWLIVGKVGGVGIGYARYAWSRTGLGIASLAFTNIGTPPNTPWSTGSLSGQTAIITVTKTCHIDLWASVFNGQFGLRLTYVTASQSPVHDEGPTSIGGGLYNQAAHFSGLLIAGEILKIDCRNEAGGLQDLHANSFMTFTDAVYTVAQV
jgi:hypothetical protein